MTGQVYEHLQQADIFILPSRAEGHSNALLEAMACGLPVIVSDIPANLDVIENNRNGLTFRTGDPASLVKAVISLLEHPELREQLGGIARQTIESQYSLSFIAERYISLYKDVLTDSNQVNQPYMHLNPTGKERT
jgi:glycosyltransferase involved in cell wall biosynthesis